MSLSEHIIDHQKLRVIDFTQLKDYSGVPVNITPDGGVVDRSAELQAILDAAPLGSCVCLPSSGVIRADNLTVPTGVSLRSNGCRLYNTRFKFKPATAQEFNTALRDIWFKRCQFDISAAGDTGTVTSATSYTLTDTSKNWAVDQFKNFFITITGGLGNGTSTYWVTGNTSNTLTVRSSAALPALNGTSTYRLSCYVSGITFDHCFIDGTGLDDSGTFIGETAGQSSMVSAFVLREFAFDVHFVNDTRICNYQGWGIDIHGNSTDDLTGTPALATGVFVTASDTKIFNMGGRNAGGTASSATTTTLVDTSKNWPTNYYAGWYVRIKSGTGAAQMRLIASNTNNTLTVLGAWTVTPNATSVYEFFCGGGIRFLGGPKDGGSLHLSNVLLDHCQVALWADDAMNADPLTQNGQSGGITVLANNLRIELSSNTGGIESPAIFNSRANTYIHGLWYSSNVATAGYRNIWHRSGEFMVRGGKMTTGGVTTFALYCDANQTGEMDLPINNPYSIGAVKPVRAFESGSSAAQETVFRLRLKRTAGGITCQALNTNGAGFGLGNGASGEQWASGESGDIINNDTSVNVSTNAFNTIYYKLNSTWDILTVTLANRAIRSAISANVAVQTANIAGLTADVQLLNGTTNFSVLFRNAAGTAVNLSTAMANGTTIDVFVRVATQRV